MRNLAMIGGGQMGRALASGMIAAKVLPADQITVVDTDPRSVAWWQEHQPQVRAVGSLDDVDGAQVDAWILAVKPHLIAPVAEQLKPIAQGKLVVSIAAGVSLQQLGDYLGHKRVVRVMPNTPCLVGAGASGFCVASDVSAEDCQWIEKALGAVGVVVQVQEFQIDAVTGLSGSGPAYICMVIESLADGGVKAGLPRPLAMQLAAQTVMGTAKMVQETGKHPGELKDAVASPGGTTIEAISVLEAGGLRSAMIEAVVASANRSKQLG
ncbi:MAG: pyrroline-5-carboxylate reductase [Rhodopirellula sp. TMED11]|nr:MAG: pyrroline-5-carboxylate reductase [Rhodopirellula sp. TMED11]